MIYSVSLVFILIIFLFIGMAFGFNRAVALIPVLFILFLIVAFFGWFAVNFFWLILLVMLINYIKNQNQPKGTKKEHITISLKEQRILMIFFVRLVNKMEGILMGEILEIPLDMLKIKQNIIKF